MKINKITVAVITLSFIFGVILTFATESIQTISVRPLCTVVVDAGHGDPDGGAVGVNGTLEKDINLSIALKVQEMLESSGVRVIMTRTDDNCICDPDADTLHEKKVSDMHKRESIINNSGADLFVSIHMNSFTDTKSSGLHVFYSRNHPEAEPLAITIQDAISKITGAKTHTVKTASDTLYLMKNPTPAAILVECGFLSNPHEEILLNDDLYQSKIAFAIAHAIIAQSRT